jgi:hypothetical protein
MMVDAKRRPDLPVVGGDIPAAEYVCLSIHSAIPIKSISSMHRDRRTKEAPIFA